MPSLPQTVSKLTLASLRDFGQTFYHKKKSNQGINLRLLSIKIDANSVENNLHLYGTNGNNARSIKTRERDYWEVVVLKGMH